MTATQRQILLDFSAYVDRKIFEDDYDTCVVTLANDASALMLDENCKRYTADEFGKIITPGGLHV